MGAAPPTGNIYESADGDPARQYGPGNRLLQKGNTRYEWDADGRLAEKREVTDEGERVWLYAWNGAGLLQSVDTPDGKRVEFAYDPFARRMEKRVARVVDGDVQAQTNTRFVWDGDVLAHEVRTRAGQSDDPVVEERAYVFEDGEFDPAAQRDGQKWLHYSNEINGAPNRLVDSRGESECEIERDAWGATHLDGKASTPFGFAGQYRDEETGLSYNRARYYDADAGRFVSGDPMGLRAGANSWHYPTSPLQDADPLGLSGSPSAKARAWQGSGDYPGVDDWHDVTLPKGTVIAMGEPGVSGYATTPEAVRGCGGSRSKLFQGLQVSKSGRPDYRPQVGLYTLTEDTVVASATTKANPHLGPGGLPQYYIPNWKDVTVRTGEIPLGS